MGDYSLGHFHFTLKVGAPKQIHEYLLKLRDGTPFSICEHTIYLGSSAYHQEETYLAVESPNYEDTAGFRYSMTFQIKYGCSQFEAFAEWLASYVIVNARNRGFIGYYISEYDDTVHIFQVDKEGRLVR